MTRVVNMYKEGYDIYIGRGSKWGNPFTHIDDRTTLAKFVVGSREESIEKYREYLMNTPELYNCLNELDGKTLGCYCKPQACHGDVLIELLSQKKLIEALKNKPK